MPKERKEINLAKGQKQTVAESKEYAALTKNLTLRQWKALIYLLSRINYATDIPLHSDSIPVTVSKKEFAESIGLTVKSNFYRQLDEVLHNLPGNTEVEYYRNGRWKKSGVLISYIESTKGKLKFSFCHKSLTWFFGLKDGYIKLGTKDILSMNSVYSIIMYEYLRLHSDSSKRVNTRQFTTKQIKELLGIPKDGEGSYMKKTGHLDRYGFEKYVLDKIAEDLKNCTFLHLLSYEKIKENNHIKGYNFIFEYPTVK